MEVTRRPALALRSATAVALYAALAWAPIAVATEIADSADQVRPPLLGSSAPSVELQSVDGSTVDMAKTVAERPTVVIFYRGGW